MCYKGVTVCCYGHLLRKLRIINYKKWQSAVHWLHCNGCACLPAHSELLAAYVEFVCNCFCDGHIVNTGNWFINTSSLTHSLIASTPAVTEVSWQSDNFHVWCGCQCHRNTYYNSSDIVQAQCLSVIVRIYFTFCIVVLANHQWSTEMLQHIALLSNFLCHLCYFRGFGIT